MNKEKIIQIVSDFDDLRERIVDMTCLQKGIKCESVKSIVINTHENGVWGEVYDFDDFSYDFFLTWEELND